jgi:hypothetical protein
MTNFRCFEDADTFSQNHTQIRRQDKTRKNVSAAEATVKVFLFFIFFNIPTH